MLAEGREALTSVFRGHDRRSVSDFFKGVVVMPTREDPSPERYSRQQFLGSNSDALLAALRAGIVGLGGGGSHIAQQLGHAGVGEFQLFDPQRIEDSNLNRVVGATARDVRGREWKTTVAARRVRAVNPGAIVRESRQPWQDAATLLRDCHVIVGCVDSYSERSQLEFQARRYLVPYVDLGMDVLPMPDGTFTVAGQVIVSLPDHPCMRCLGFLNDALLAREAEGYGAAGPRPQVVWSNGVLASIAVGIIVQLFLPWHGLAGTPLYLEYDGNRGTVAVSRRTLYLAKQCQHFDGAQSLGDPWFPSKRQVRPLKT